MKEITIESTTGADTRSAKGPVSKEVLLSNSHLHRSHVRRAMAALSAELIERAERHDYTKISAIDDFHENFTQAIAKEIEFKDHRWWKLHLAEKHHINDRMHDDADLLDLLEMIVDCVCAGKARTGDVFPIKIESDVLQKLLSNTFDLLSRSVHSKLNPSKENT